jgi:uncharacterized protein YbaP (TraB family)
MPPPRHPGESRGPEVFDLAGRWTFYEAVLFKREKRMKAGPFCNKLSNRRQNMICADRRPIMPLIIALIVLALSGSPAFLRSAFSYDQKNFLWKVQSRTSTVYLLGSIHFLRQDSYPLDRRIEDAYESSDNLVVEANISQLDKLDLTGLTDRAFYKNDDHVEKHVSPETYRLMKKKSETLGIPVELIRMQKPWFLALSLQAMELMRLGYEPQYGVDYHFLESAQGKKRILELESLDEQLDLLSGFSDQEQEQFLLYTLKTLNSMGRQVEDLVRAWRSGDAQGLESILAEAVTQDAGIAPIFGRLFEERNIRMASRIEQYLGSSGTYFVIIGAGHLVGNKGILQLIRSKGYSIEQL